MDFAAGGWSGRRGGEEAAPAGVGARRLLCVPLRAREGRDGQMGMGLARTKRDRHEPTWAAFATAPCSSNQRMFEERSWAHVSIHQ